LLLRLVPRAVVVRSLQPIVTMTERKHRCLTTTTSHERRRDCLWDNRCQDSRVARAATIVFWYHCLSTT
jgi:hypothetical protein